MSDAFHWDGSPKEDALLGFRTARTMWLHRSNKSTLLRRDAMAKCRYCGLAMEYFDRYDDLRIPMTPKTVPSRAVPPRMRWQIMNGIAYPGDGGLAVCRVPHPAFCPQVEHEDDDPQLAHARAVYRKRSEGLIASGQFIPDLVPPRCEEDVAEQHVQDVGEVRHVIAYSSRLLLAPSRVDTIQCVARADSTGERCKNTVWTEEGHWEEVEIPYVPGRAGQQVLWAGSRMWVFALHALYPDEFSRWMKQRCPSHASGYTPDAVPPEWVSFDPWRHEDHILRERPAGVAEPKRVADHIADMLLGPKRTRCATSGCLNGSDAPVPEGWLCWQCSRLTERRERIHQKWGNPTRGNVM